MVIVGTQLSVSDNSGAVKVNCIQILGAKCNRSNLGDKLVVSVRKAKFESKVKKGSVQHAILITKKNKTYRKNGSYISFIKNSVVLVKKPKDNENWRRVSNDLIGNRLIGGATLELRYKKGMKIILLASYII